MISRNQLFQFLQLEPVYKLARNIKYRNRILSLVYHEVLEDADNIDAWTVVKASDFEKQMKYLKSNFDVVSLDDAIEIIGNSSAHKGKYAVVTFDDGYAGNKNVVKPILEGFKIPAIIYVATSSIESGKVFWYDQIITAIHRKKPLTVELKKFGLPSFNLNYQRPGIERWKETAILLEALKSLEPHLRKEAVEEILSKVPVNSCNEKLLKPLTIDDIKEMSRSPLITFGAHSHCHNILTQLNEQELKESITHSKNLLSSWTGYTVRHFAYPNGDFNEAVVKALLDAGFVSSQALLARIWQKSDSLMAVPRIAIGRYDTIGYFKALTSGAFV